MLSHCWNCFIHQPIKTNKSNTYTEGHPTSMESFFIFLIFQTRFLLWLWVFWNSLYRPGWPRTLGSLHASASWVLESKVFTTPAQWMEFFVFFKEPNLGRCLPSKLLWHFLQVASCPLNHCMCVHVCAHVHCCKFTSWIEIVARGTILVPSG